MIKAKKVEQQNEQEKSIEGGKKPLKVLKTMEIEILLDLNNNMHTEQLFWSHKTVCFQMECIQDTCRDERKRSPSFDAHFLYLSDATSHSSYSWISFEEVFFKERNKHSLTMNFSFILLKTHNVPPPHFPFVHFPCPGARLIASNKQ